VFLRETLGLELNQQKTLITHARSQRARFLGYHVTVQHCDTKLTHGQRSANGRIALKVPPDVIRAQCARYREHGKPWHRSRLQNLDDYDIVKTYGAEYAGVDGAHRKSPVLLGESPRLAGPHVTCLVVCSHGLCPRVVVVS